MATRKPQFSCYLDPSIDAEIETYLAKNGLAKGKLIEQLWRFYNFRDQSLILEKFAREAAKEMSPKDKYFFNKLVTLLQTILKGDS